MIIMKEKKSMGNNCIIVRVLKDVPQFIGNDMKKYSLKEDDIVTLPQDIAKILIERGVAEEIKQG
jgi:DNA replication initiation complex subunit (GINS family)